ncbi:MAG: PTS sugar transporter subunit IIA [candidate division Zixibacteria bacterium]|nr:PTS sugar transporter subunit IIA [candidate division Zixibacteria bacterium]
MRLANILDEDLVIHRLEASNKHDAMTELLDKIINKYPQYDYDTILKCILEREEIQSTSYGRNIAFPHARTDAVDEMVAAVGVSPEGLDAKTPDGKPLHVVCLMLTPSNIAKLYLQTLSAFAAFARNPINIDMIIKTTSPGSVIDAIWESGVAVEKELTAKDIMHHNVFFVRPDESLRRVANLMFRHKLSALAVVDDDHNLLGEISDKEMIQAALPDFKSLISNLNYSLDIEPFEELLKREDKIKVKQLFATDHEVVTKETKIVEVAAMMLFKDLRRVFVVEGTRLTGILLRKDIVNMIIRG